MQTAVEWLQELNQNVDLNEDDFKKAIEMEIRQIQDACTDVYNKVKEIEISDEEIEKAVKDPMNDAYDFREGAKWYREQLKKKQ